MGEPVTLARAQLIELDAQFRNPAPNGRRVEVQLNPESLKVTYANRAPEQKSAGDERGNSTRQTPAVGSTKLALQLWFDVGAPRAGGARDVRELTGQVLYFMKPRPTDGGGGQPAPPPGVRFAWGTFVFDGLVDSLEETLDFFSPDGRPLRAALSLGFSGQLEIVPPAAGGSPRSAAGPTAGTRPLTAATAGSTLQGLAAAAGAGGDWQTVAAANGIENPRLLAAGQLVDLNLGVRAGVR